MSKLKVKQTLGESSLTTSAQCGNLPLSQLPLKKWVMVLGASHLLQLQVSYSFSELIFY
jgi:hypothetical protein